MLIALSLSAIIFSGGNSTCLTGLISWWNMHTMNILWLPLDSDIAHFLYASHGSYHSPCECIYCLQWSYNVCHLVMTYQAGKLSHRLVK